MVTKKTKKKKAQKSKKGRKKGKRNVDKKRKIAKQEISFAATIEAIEKIIEGNPEKAKDMANKLIKEIKKQEEIDEEQLIRAYELLIDSKLSSLK